MRPETHRGAPPEDERWLQIQSHFVDDPKRSVEEATALVRAQLANAAERLDAVERRARSLEAGEAATEEMRRCVQSLHRIADGLSTL